MIVLREPPGQHDAQLGSVLAAADGRFGIVVELLVDDRHAAGLGAGTAAAAYENIDLRRIHAFLLQHIEDHLVPEGHLGIDMGELQQDRRVVEPAFAENFLFIQEEADFGGCGTGIDDKQSEFHGLPPYDVPGLYPGDDNSLYSRIPP